MNNEKKCACQSGEKLIFACSGAADVGAIADQAARKLSREGTGRMFCLTGIGGGIEGIIKTTEAAARILAIDGCPINCAKNTLKKAEINNFEYLNLTDIGLLKGKSEVSENNIEKVVRCGKEKLAC